MRSDLLEILKKMFLTHAVEFGKFTLSSGKKTNVYVNSKKIMFRSDGSSLIGKLIYEKTFDLNIDCVGGMESGAIPIVSSTLAAYHQASKSLRGFYVRKKTKEHGSKSLIEGIVNPQDRVLLVEDVTTTGESTLKAINEVFKVGASVVKVISLCDREEGAAKLLSRYHFSPLFKLSDLDIDSLPR